MTTQEFKRNGNKYSPGREVSFGGEPWRIWFRYRYAKMTNEWLYQDSLTIPDGQSKGRIIKLFKDCMN